MAALIFSIIGAMRDCMIDIDFCITKAIFQRTRCLPDSHKRRSAHRSLLGEAFLVDPDVKGAQFVPSHFFAHCRGSMARRREFIFERAARASTALQIPRKPRDTFRETILAGGETPAD